jgi:hypothetical protein
MQFDPPRVAEAICRILHTVYVERRAVFTGAAAERGIALEALAAAVITGMLREELDIDSRSRRLPAKPKQRPGMVLPFRAVACCPPLSLGGPNRPSA